MTSPRRPGDTPPDLPPEYAEAYRRGYERAYQAGAGADPGPADPESPEPADPPEPAGLSEPTRAFGPVAAAPQAEAVQAEAEPESWRPVEAPDPSPFEPSPEPSPEPPPGPSPEPWHGRGTVEDAALFDQFGSVPRGSYETPTHRGEPREPSRRPGWFVPALLGGLVLILLVMAYGMGLVFSSSVDDADVSSGEPDGVVLGEDPATDEPAGPTPSTKDSPSESAEEPGGNRYQGRTTSAVIGGSTASCRAPSSVDAAGNPVRYPAKNIYDGDLSTAWRCNGDGVGQTVTLMLPGSVEVGEVGLVPGYAKTDPRSGADRYAENNRITLVRWTFSDGTTVRQRLDGSATNRDLQTIRIPVTSADEVVLEVLASTRGPRNTVAISEVRLGEAA